MTTTPTQSFVVDVAVEAVAHFYLDAMDEEEAAAEALQLTETIRAIGQDANLYPEGTITLSSDGDTAPARVAEIYNTRTYKRSTP